MPTSSIFGKEIVTDNGYRVATTESCNVDPMFRDLTVDGNNNYYCSEDNQSCMAVAHNTRKGAISTYIEPWSLDVIDFLDLRKNSGEERRRAHDLFPALWTPDLFMERVLKNEMWTLLTL